jgi:hypothetical protein
MTNQTALVTDKTRLSAFNTVSSLGLIVLGVMGLAEACGVAVQSILTVGGVGGNVLNSFEEYYMICIYNNSFSKIVCSKKYT